MAKLKNKTHERFAQLIAAGHNNGSAHKLINPTAKQSSSLGHSLRIRPDVQARIEEILRPSQAKEEKLLLLSREALMDKVSKIINANPEDAAMNNSLCDVRVDKFGNKIPVFPAKLAAVERLSKMAGYEKIDLNLKLSEKVMEIVKGGENFDV